MKIIAFAALLGVCLGAKLPGHVDDHHQDGGFVHQDDTRTFVEHQGASHDRPVVAILYDDREAPAEGAFSTAFETEDGVKRSESGQPGSLGQSNVQGSYSFTDQDGNFVEVNYVADEFGFRAESPFIPTTPPIPAHALQQIAYAEEIRRLRAENGENPNLS